MTLELDKEAVDASMDFAMQALKRIPRGDKQVLEAHITGVLVVFWGALWGSFGTDYARDFIEAQLNSMEPDKPHEKYTEPTVQ